MIFMVCTFTRETFEKYSAKEILEFVKEDLGPGPWEITEELDKDGIDYMIHFKTKS